MPWQRQQSASSRGGRQTPRISVKLESFLRAELKRQPEIRPEVVARARALLQDPDYPRIEIFRSVASKILAAPDLSEEES